MATLSTILDVRRPKKDGTCPVMISISHRGSKKLISLNVHLKPEHWDAKKHEVKTSSPLASRLNLYIQRMNLLAKEALLSLDVNAEHNLSTMAAAITAALFPEKAEEKANKELLLYAAEKFTALKIEKGTRLTYERTMNYLKKFRPNAKLGEVTRSWLLEFDVFMSQTAPSPNSRAIHMRNLRAIFNFAIDEGYTQNYPFRKFHIKTVKTAKRNLTADDLRQLFLIEVEDWQEIYRDFFFLSFTMIGINAKDLLLLPADAIENGRIIFNRAKTKRLYSIKVEPEAAAIIEKYRGKNYLLNIMDERDDYLQFIRQCNHALQCIGTTGRKGCKRTGTPLFPSLTTYYARHSWATIARSIGISIDDIAAALGHGDGHNLTHIYIDEDTECIDAANRKVLDRVFCCKC